MGQHNSYFTLTHNRMNNESYGSESKVRVECRAVPLDQGLSNYCLQAKSSLLPVSVNKVLLGYRHTICFSVCGCFHTAMPEPSSYEQMRTYGLSLNHLLFCSSLKKFAKPCSSPYLCFKFKL